MSAARTDTGAEAGTLGDFSDQLLTPDYFYTYSEPHRQRPTLVRFPQFVVHLATFYDVTSAGGRETDKQDTPGFEAWLRQFANDKKWRRRDWTDSKEEHAIPPATLWANASPFSWESFLRPFAHIALGAADEESKVEFYFEAVHADHPDIVVRVEAHREYFCLTLFCPLDNAPGDIRNWFADVGDYLFPAGWESRSALHDLIHSIAHRFPTRTFANFRGVVATEDCLPAIDGERPSFASHDSGEKPDLNPRQTERFLRAQRGALAETVFVGDTGQDAVACYLQRGQAIYVSSLGSQSASNSKQELRYLLLYKEGDRYSERFRLSRLVYRLHALGTLRLAALRDLGALRRVNDELREIEVRLEHAAHSRLSKRRKDLMEVINALEDLATRPTEEGVLIFYRTARARHYFDHMKRHLEDLDVGHIPDWQNYKQFLNRRLYATLELVAGMGQRVLGLWELARSRAELAEANALMWFQSAAGVASIVLVPLTFAAGMKDVLPKELAIGVTNYLREITSAPVDGAVANAFAWVRAQLPASFATPMQNMTPPDHEVVNFWLIFIATMFLWGAALMTFDKPARKRAKRRTTKHRPH